MAAPNSGRTAKQRPEDRLGHRSAAEQSSVTRIDATDHPAPVIPPPSPMWTDSAIMVWQSILASPLKVYYEGTDYAVAYILCDLIADLSTNGLKTRGQIESLRKMMVDLGMTESSRRAADMIIQRIPVNQDPARVRAIETARSRRDSA